MSTAKRLIVLIVAAFSLAITSIQSQECDCNINVISHSATYAPGFVNGAGSGCGPSQTDNPNENWNGKTIFYRALNTGGNNLVYDFQINCLQSCWIKSVNIGGGCGWWQSQITLYNGDKSVQLGTRLISPVSMNDYVANMNLDLSGNQVYLNQFRFTETNIDKVARYRGPITIITQQAPTTSPTKMPTPLPTYKNCADAGEIKQINWNKLQNDVNNIQEIPNYNFNISLNKERLEMTFDIDLEYVGLSFDDNSNSNNLGTTYVIDFQSFQTNGDYINKPGNCQNRLETSFNAVNDFNKYWTFSEYPYLPNELGSNSYLSYPPPSDNWQLSIEYNTCSPINYLGVFSWNDLTQCTDYNGNKLMNVIDNNISITLSGTLYVNLVSPYSMGITDTGISRTFPLIQQDFEISLVKQINVLSSTGIELFIVSIIGVYEKEIDGSFQISILTQSADYIELTNPMVISSPLETAIITEVTTSCLVASSYTCGQIFTLTIDESQISCPPADFSGNYNLQFEVNCPGNEQVCNTFIDDNDGSIVALQVESNFIDTTCIPQLYEVIFTGNMQFYDDDQFNIVHNDQNGDNNYIIGQNIIYVQIETIFPDDGSGDNFVIFGVIIDNVFVCTADDNIDLTLNLNQQNGNGGCLSSNIDPDGPYNIISNGIANNQYQTQIISNSGVSNIVQFSFLTFDIGRTKIYIHVQLTLILQNGNRRRLQILSSNLDGNQIRHFIDSISVTQQIIIQTQKPETEDQTNNSVSMLSIVLTIFIFFPLFW